MESTTPFTAGYIYSSLITFLSSVISSKKVCIFHEILITLIFKKKFSKAGSATYLFVFYVFVKFIFIQLSQNIQKLAVAIRIFHCY